MAGSRRRAASAISAERAACADWAARAARAQRTPGGTAWLGCPACPTGAADPTGGADPAGTADLEDAADAADPAGTADLEDAPDAADPADAADAEDGAGAADPAGPAGVAGTVAARFGRMALAARSNRIAPSAIMRPTSSPRGTLILASWRQCAIGSPHASTWNCQWPSQPTVTCAA